MKKKNIFKLFSLLGLGSVVGLAAASCSTDGASADASKTDVEAFINGLAQDKIEAYKGDAKVENKAQTETKDVTKFDLVQAEKNNAKAKGWTIAIAKATDGENAAEGKIKVTIKATKGTETVTRTTALEITGFKAVAKEENKTEDQNKPVDPEKQQGDEAKAFTKDDATKFLAALKKESFTVKENVTAETAKQTDFDLVETEKTKLPTDWVFSITKAERDGEKTKLSLSLAKKDSNKDDEKANSEFTYEYTKK
ncbi:hypothetical protein [Mycoplasma sp. E35C]|uniref:hypothetical protein n=1 Tax=Mycoplasma sp. E35C TaxID=2801918 RepID=UPI001CA3BBB3|nr:hypothetical protein [Mycoplasma sp. E35C]QZX48877.1 hypothetical protein JJE79_02350 [Mycoplasma sp. E35C]